MIEYPGDELVEVPAGDLGLGEAARVDLLEVYWPTTGQTQTFRDVAADRFIRINEGDARIEALAPGCFRISGDSR